MSLNLVKKILLGIFQCELTWQSDNRLMFLQLVMDPDFHYATKSPFLPAGY